MPELPELPELSELPDITVDIERLLALAGGQVLQRLRLRNPFLLRTALPPVGRVEGCRLQGVQRLNKRMLPLHHPESPGTEWLPVIHLMRAGRLRWLIPGARRPGQMTLAPFEFEAGTLVLTEAGTRRLASLQLLPDRAALAAMDPGGVEVLQTGPAGFSAALRHGNPTLKRADRPAPVQRHRQRGV